MKLLLIALMLVACGCEKQNGWTWRPYLDHYRINGVERGSVGEGMTGCLAWVWNVDQAGHIEEISLGRYLDCSTAKAAVENAANSKASR